jgi:DNA invertase Pin-like site-specific DNA recombinase
VSSSSQAFASQLPELEEWAKRQEGDVHWYKDMASGTTMNRPAMDELMAAINQGKVVSVACWRLDRMGRTAAGLTQFFETLRGRHVNFISLRDGLDLSTPAGRLMAHVLSSVSAYEVEVKKERQMAGISAARASGKRWGGSPKGRRWKVGPDHLDAVRTMRSQGKSVATIAKMTGLSRPTVYQIIRMADRPAA